MLPWSPRDYKTQAVLQVWRKLFFHRSRSPARSKNEEGRRKRLSGLKKKRQKVGLRISGRCATVDQIHVAEGPKNPRDPICVFGTHQTRYVVSNFGQEKDIHSKWFNPRTLMNAVALLENLRIVLQEQRQQRSDVPAEQRWDLAKSVNNIHGNLDQKQSYVLLAFGGLFFRHPQ